MQIDLEAVEDLALNGAKQETIADALEFSVNLFRTHKDLKRCYKKAVAERKINLRHWQTQKAKSGDTGMLIWLGKQELGQREPKTETDVNLKENAAADEKLKTEIAAIQAGYRDEQSNAEIGD